jgi:DNA-directed RNA polymerase specialized sigma24 family protein
MSDPKTLRDHRLSLVVHSSSDRNPGRAEALRDLAREHLRVIHRYALHLTMDRSEADELVRRTIDLASRARRGPAPGTSVQEWLLATLYSAFLVGDQPAAA